MSDPFRKWEHSFNTPLRPKRSHSVTGGGGAVIAALVLLFGVACLYGWFLMLAIGVLASHNVVGGTLPFWDSVIVAALLGGIFGSASAASSS